MFRSITYGKLTKEQMFDIIRKKLQENNRIYLISVGTDSQNHNETKIVTVISLHEVGHGGIFFYKTVYISRIDDLRHKIYTETQYSLDLTKELTEYLFDNDIDVKIVVHVDIGKTGKTSSVIREIMGWVHAEGYECFIKPNSIAASCIADRISK